MMVKEIVSEDNLVTLTVRATDVSLLLFWKDRRIFCVLLLLPQEGTLFSMQLLSFVIRMSCLPHPCLNVLVLLKGIM